MTYRRRNSVGLNRKGPADRVCLSYTHDPDYKRLMPKKLQYHMKSDAEAESTAASTADVATVRTWVRVCAADDIPEGGAKTLSLERENEQVAVFRHHGELFALDNRCAHMGGPLFEECLYHVTPTNPD